MCLNVAPVSYGQSIFYRVSIDKGIILLQIEEQKTLYEVALAEAVTAKSKIIELERQLAEQGSVNEEALVVTSKIKELEEEKTELRNKVLPSVRGCCNAS